jgi:dCTP deaminase
MSFISTETWRHRCIREGWVTPYDDSRLKHGAYQLALGPEAKITNDDSNIVRKLAPGDRVAIPPGQFAFLLTEEKVRIPDDCIGFISVRARLKFDGLVNVSGFHVDPGYRGRLLFSVFNAGSKKVIIARGDDAFLIWLAKLDLPTADLYAKQPKHAERISSELAMSLTQEVDSPQVLRKKVDALDTKVRELDNAVATWKGLTAALLIAMIVAIAAAIYTMTIDFRGRINIPPISAVP